MSDEHKPLYTRHFGQDQEARSATLSVDELRRGVSKLNRTARVRTWIKGPAYLIATGAFGAQIFTAQSPLMRVVACSIAIGWGYLLYQVIWSHRRVPRRVRIEREPRVCAALYRSELERERDYFRRTAVWLPLVFSATVALILVRAAQLRVSLAWAAQFRGMMMSLIIVMTVIWTLLVLFHIQQNFGLARRCQRELDKLNAGATAAVGN